MSTLIIRKKSLKTWLHTDSILGDFIISKFYFNADNLSFQIVEQGQSRRVIYNITDITLYAEPTGGTAETFTTITELSLRLEELNYPAFQYDGQITSIANLIDAGTNITITGDGTEASPYVINSTGGGGSQTLAEVLVEGNITDGTDISISDGDKIVLNNGANLKKGTTDAGLGGSKGIALRCAVDYELKWEAGRLYVMDGDGFTIREVSHNFTTTPTVNDDDTKGFVIDSRWILDDGDVYVCTDDTTGAAVWELVNTGTTPTLQEVLDNNHDLVDGINLQGTGAGDGNTGIEIAAFGTDAAKNNTGSAVISIGYGAAQDNSGSTINALGSSAAYSNTGSQINAFGNGAAYDNNADNINAFGTDSAINNTGNNVNALGANAANNNTGENVNALGNSAGLVNSFNNVNLFGNSASADEDGQTVLSKDGAIMARISTTDLTDTRKYNLPDASGTLALTTDIPTLQEVTDQGNETINSIKVIDTGNTSTQLQANGIYFEDLDDLGSTNLRFLNTSVATQEIEIRGLGGTMALLSDIPDTSTFVPYTGATADVDLGENGIDAKFVKIKGTAGAGHLSLKHQSSSITASGSESSLGADSVGNPVWKNDGNALQNILLNTNITQTITNGVTDKAPSEDAVFDALALKPDELQVVLLSQVYS